MGSHFFVICTCGLTSVIQSELGQCHSCTSFAHFTCWLELQSNRLQKFVLTCIYNGFHVPHVPPRPVVHALHVYKVFRATKYYKVLLGMTKYYKVLLRVTKYCSVLQSTTQVYSALQSATKNYKVYYIVLLRTSTHYSVLQSTTQYYSALQSVILLLIPLQYYFVLHCTTYKVLLHSRPSRPGSTSFTSFTSLTSLTSPTPTSHVPTSRATQPVIVTLRQDHQSFGEYTEGY